MIERLTAYENMWGRFAEYTVQGGYILPAPGAEYRPYSPFELYWTARKKGKQPPYQSLFALLKRIGAADREQDGSAEGEIAAWCSQYGLLGILPHRAESVTLAPVYKDLPLDLDDTEEPEEWPASSTRYERRNGYWEESADTVFVSGDLAPRACNEGEPVPPQLWIPPATTREAYRMPPSFAADNPVINRPGLSHWGQYFPGVDPGALNLYQYPRPHTKDFWRIYAEPVDGFIAEAQRLGEAIEFEPSIKTDFHVEFFPDQMLDYFINPVGLRVERTLKGERREQWRYPSLLGAFAKMALNDQVTGSRILQCCCCGMPFVTSAYQAKYCSVECGWRHRKRVARERNRGRKAARR